MSLLDHSEARALLADAVLTPEAVRGCECRLTEFLGRYLLRFYRAEHRANATLVAAHRSIRTAMLEKFAVHESLSVQQALRAMGETALRVCDAAVEVTLTMPNNRRSLFDLERFGRSNVNEILVATDDPFGLITGTLQRV